MQKPITFKSHTFKPNNQPWYFAVFVPQSKVKTLIAQQSFRILCTINKNHQYQAALIHNGDGNYFILINKSLQKKAGIMLGDEVQVTIEKDTSDYGLPMPTEFEMVLEQDGQGQQLFEQLTPGKKRTLLFIVGKPKSSDLRIRNSIAVIEHLKNNGGKIVFKQLQSDIRNQC
jgi:hypothetical protein